MNVRGRAAIFCAAALAVIFIAYGVGGTPRSRADAIPISAHRNLDANFAGGYRDPDLMRALVHRKIKHVFVLVQENHTFDNYFGLYPGTRGQWVENLASPTAQTDDCVPDPWAGTHACQRPFLITTNPHSANYVPDAPDITDGDNDRFGQQYAIDGGKMDGFLIENEAPNPLGPKPTPLPAPPTASDVENHNLDLGLLTTYDCDTVPYLWYYAKNFALFDHYFEANAGDSTPANVELFAAQIGQTEVAAGKAPVLSTLAPGADGYSNGMPLGNDSNPPPLQIPFLTPYGGATAAQSISVASLPVLLNPRQDAAAVSSGVEGLIPSDLAFGAQMRHTSVPWAWYEEGAYASDSAAVQNAFSPHHDAPLYFDYINNPRSPFGTPVTLRDNTREHGLISDIRTGELPPESVYWVKGGAHASTYGFEPADRKLAKIYVGEDDHPGTNASDHQVAEAYVATLVNAIAASKYWKDSVVILTWDDSGGMYDHYPPNKYGATCPDDKTGTFAGTPCGDGVRLPLLVISPFAKQGAVVHAPSDGGSIAKFIEEVFDLPKLASLPDELTGTRRGLAPSDANPYTGDLTDALDIDKLRRDDRWSAPRSAIIPNPSVPPLMSCATLGIRPLNSPASLPQGFETAGWYALNPVPSFLRAVPRHSDTND
jgi:phospholipase C